MDELKFEFTMLSTVDGKTNVLCLTAIFTPGGNKYLIPDEYLHMEQHEELKKTAVFSKIKNSIKKRHQVRRISIPLTKELRKTYLDEAGNLQFNGIFLEEKLENKDSSSSKSDANQEKTLADMLEKLLENKQNKPEKQNLGKIAERFMIEKFSSKAPNALQWINEFEKECERFQIHENEHKIEILKYFLEKSCLDLYRCVLMRLTVHESWEE